MKVSRQRQWQIDNPERQKLIKEQTKINRKRSLLEAGIAKTQEEIHDIITGFEWRTYGRFGSARRLSGDEWWEAFEYLDWKYNGSAYTDLELSRKLRSFS